MLKMNTYGETQQYEIQMESHILKKTRKKGGGRKPTNKVVYEEIDDHIEGVIISNEIPFRFKIDKDDLEKVQSRHWYVASGGNYVGSCMTVDGAAKVLYLHNFVMDRIVFPGRGAKESVDHINRDKFDNRKSNLRLVAQSIQNTNQKKRQRTANLPEGFADLPKHIWYIKSHGAHGDRFCVELKTEGISRKTSSSKKLTLQEKFQEALKIREELYEQYPYLRSTD